MSNLFPYDAITFTTEISGVTSQNIMPGSTPKTVLSVAMQQENQASNTVVECGSNLIAKNYATNFSAVPMSYRCFDTLRVSKTGNDKSTVIVTYVPYDISTTTPDYNPSTNIASSSDIKIYGSMTAGEVLISFLIFSLICVLLTRYMIQGLDKIKTKRKYLQYGGGDVEVREDA